MLHQPNSNHFNANTKTKALHGTFSAGWNTIGWGANASASDCCNDTAQNAYKHLAAASPLAWLVRPHHRRPLCYTATHTHELDPIMLARRARVIWIAHTISSADDVDATHVHIRTAGDDDVDDNGRVNECGKQKDLFHLECCFNWFSDGVALAFVLTKIHTHRSPLPSASSTSERRTARCWPKKATIDGIRCTQFVRKTRNNS